MRRLVRGAGALALFAMPLVGVVVNTTPSCGSTCHAPSATGSVRILADNGVITNHD
jgi:hypothetical protein